MSRRVATYAVGTLRQTLVRGRAAPGGGAAGTPSAAIEAEVGVEPFGRVGLVRPVRAALVVAVARAESPDRARPSRRPAPAGGPRGTPPPRLDERQRQPGERMADDDRVRLAARSAPRTRRRRTPTSSHGRSGAHTSCPRASSSRASGAQYQPPSHAPWTRTKRATRASIAGRYDRAHARRRPHRDRDALRRGRRGRLRRLPAARAVPRRQRLRRARRRRNDRRGARRSPTPSGSTLIRAAVEAVGDRATIVAGTGTNDTAHSVHVTEQAHEAGVDGCLVVTPYYNKPPQRGIVAHFEAVARATDLPIVAYNIPSRIVINIEPETISRLAEIENVTRREAGERRHGAGAAHRRARASTCTRATTTSCSRSSSSAASAGSASTRTSSGRRSPSRCVPSARATSSAPREIDRELAPAYELLRVARTRSRSRPR